MEKGKKEGKEKKGEKMTQKSGRSVAYLLMATVKPRGGREGEREKILA